VLLDFFSNFLNATICLRFGRIELKGKKMNFVKTFLMACTYVRAERGCAHIPLTLSALFLIKLIESSRTHEASSDMLFK
jgi:hypothetical protein